MISIEVIIRDENGKRINGKTEHICELSLNDKSFSSVETAVEKFKNSVLPDMEECLLRKFQEEFTGQVKNGKCLCNGLYPVKIKSLHGAFVFGLQRYLIFDEGEEIHSTYFEMTGQFGERYISTGLTEFCSYYANRLSYCEVAGLTERTTGKKLLTGQTVRNIVTEKASVLNREFRKEVENILNGSEYIFPEISSEPDIYDPVSDEVLLFDDGIQVKSQKEHRKKNSSEEETGMKRKRINTDVAVLQMKNGNFEYMISVTDKDGNEIIPLKDVIKSRILREYGNRETPLNVIAVTDGAKDIRLRLQEIFGFMITVISDWFHLCKKVREYMSMTAVNKEEKIMHLKYLMFHLWRGMTEEVLNCLKENVKTKSRKRLTELAGYIEKHRSEIPDYRRRKEAGKTVGSGRGEKACDQVVGHRQKKKGMSWSKSGNKALAVLKIAELNGRWDGIWMSDDYKGRAA